MRPLAIILLIAGFLGLVYYMFAFTEGHREEIVRGQLPALMALNDRICGCITCGIVALVGALLLLQTTVETSATDLHRQLNEIHNTFNLANKTTIEQNDDVIRNAADLKRDRKERMRAESTPSPEA